MYIGRLWAALEPVLITARLITAWLITTGLMTTGLITAELCDIHWRKLGGVTYIEEFWTVCHTSEKIGWCDIHWRKLAGVTYI